MLLEDRADSFAYPAQRDWQTVKAAQRYRDRRSPEYDRRFEREDEIIGRWLDDLPPESLVLDVPCGAGRLIEPVTRRRLRYIGADISPAMLEEARASAPSPLVHGFHRADAAALPFADDSVDCVIIWRLLHHIRSADVRRSILSEAARVTRRTVLLSFHHPFSAAAMRKKFYRRFLGKGNGVEFTAKRLAHEAAACGLRLAATQGYRKYISINWFACMEKA